MGKKNNKKFEITVTRPQVERMVAIVTRIKKGDYPSRKDLADEWGVTTKTIQRDIDFMRDREGIPIEYDPFKYGYHLTEPLTHFPLMQISEGEVVALFVAQKALAQYRGTPFETPLRLACDKLVESLKGEFSVAWGDLDAAISFRGIDPNPVDIKLFKDLSSAIRAQQEVTFDYCKLGSKVFETRRLQPYHLTCVNHQWYALGFDPFRKAKRTFMLGRMQNLKLLDTKFTRPKSFSVDKFLKGSFGVFSGTEPVEIKIWFDAFAARLIRERSWHHSQKIIALPNDELQLNLMLTSTVEIQQWIMSWGSHAKVLAPVELIRTLLVDLERMRQTYARSPNLSATS
jgi:predicted DNA-binding transcriptional regulator YafY